MQENQNQMTEKEYLNDFIIGQKQISSSYNTFAAECVDPKLRNEFLNILKEEHDIAASLYADMQSRGWYQVKQAGMQEIDQAKQKYINMQ